MANRIRALWREGQAAINGWLAIPSGFAAETMAQAGWDSLTVDLQHGVQDYLSAVACFQAIQPHPVVPLARAPWNEPGIIGKLLDAGAMGIIGPMIDSPADARAFVAACRYPPLGRRSVGPIRAGIYGEPGGYLATANEEILVIPMVETRGALEQLDAILDTPGIDAVYVGPNDLGFALGFPPRLDREEPEMLRVYERILEACGRRGVIAGLHNAEPAYARRMIAMGFRLVTLQNDSTLLLKAARAVVRATRGE